MQDRREGRTGQEKESRRVEDLMTLKLAAAISRRTEQIDNARGPRKGIFTFVLVSRFRRWKNSLPNSTHMGWKTDCIITIF